MIMSISTWCYLVMNREEVSHVTGRRSRNIYKFLLLRHASVPLGKAVTAAGLTAITEKTRHAMKFTGKGTHFITWKGIGPLESPQKHHCTAHTWPKHYHQVIYGQMLVGELQLFSPFCPLQSTGWVAALVPAVAVCIYPFNDRRCVLILTQLMMWIGWRRIIYKLLSISRMSGGPRISNREVQTIIILL